MSWLELNSALSAAVFRKRLSELGEYSFVSKLSLTECRGKAQIVQLLKNEGAAWEAILHCKKAGEEEKVFEKRVRNQLGNVPFEDVKMEVKPPLCEASDISDLKEEVKHEQGYIGEEQKPFVFDFEGSPSLLKKEDPGSGSEEEDGFAERTEDEPNLDNIVAGREDLSFNRFKMLMESGRLTLDDLGEMKNVRVVEVANKGQVVQFLATSAKDFNKLDLKELGLDDVQPVNSILGKKALKKLKKGKDVAKIASEVADLVTELLKKKSTVLTCQQCEQKFLNTITAVTHIETSHVEVLNKATVLLNALGEDKNPKKKVRQMLKAGVSKICDPDLLIEQVVVKTRNMLQIYRFTYSGSKTTPFHSEGSSFCSKEGFSINFDK